MQNSNQVNKTYSALLSSERFRPSVVRGRDLIAESESDRGRLLFCAAFRRLQQKAQVFSMEQNAAVRSRLTHSFEVSQIGRYIADQVTKELAKKELASTEECRAIVNFVETACLMHDIGNPPFGHFGEAAIQKWFSDNGDEAIKESCGDGKESNGLGSLDKKAIKALADFKQFDGNPQGLRIVSRLQWNSDEYGLNLTKTTLASYLKYIRSSDLDCNISINSKFTKKCGFFITEEDLVKEIWRYLGYESAQRFPLAYIMEAADDIAYCISDLEDSIEKGLLQENEALTDIYKQWITLNPKNDTTCDLITTALKFASEGKNDKGDDFTYTDFRTSINRVLVFYAAEKYINQHDEVLAGRLDALLAENSGAGIMLNVLKSYCRSKVYCHESVQRIELAGYAAIYGLLKHFSCLLHCSEKRFKASLDYENKDDLGNLIILEKKLLALFPDRYIKVYKHSLIALDPTNSEYKFLEWNARAHLIVDYISGMTDDYAMTTFRELSGMQL
jgi:dGTPase